MTPSYSRSAVTGATVGSDVGARIASAFRWAVSATLVGQLATWAMTLVAIRLLAPEDYGLMASGTVVIGLLMLANELGLGAALVQRTARDERAEAAVFAVALGINGGLFCALALAAPLLAASLGDSRLSPLLRVLALQFIISAFEIVPLARLERELDFRRKSLVCLAASVSGGLVTLALALAGAGVWALAGGALWLALVRAIGINAISPMRCWPRLRIADVAGLVGFGSAVTVERALWFFYTQVDLLIVGFLLGPQALGYYAVAMHLASLLMHKTGELVSELTFPAFARVQANRPLAAAYLVKAVRLMSILAFPIFLGISSIAPDLVAVVLGKQWQPVAPLLSLLVLVMPLRMVSGLYAPALQGVGRPGASVGNLVVAAVVMPSALAVGAYWGVFGLALAWVVGFPLVFSIVTSRACAVLGVRVGAIIAAMAGPAGAAVLMYGAVLAGQGLLAGAVSAPTRMGASVALGALCYGGVIVIWHPSRWREMLALVRP